MSLTFSLAFSDTSLVLLASIIALTLYSKYFNTNTPLVHPLLLQRQSELSQTRKQGESAVYRNWATGHGSPLSTSPAGNVKVVGDVVLSESAPGVTRFGEKVTNQQLRESSNIILSNLAKLAPQLLSPTSTPIHILSLLPPSLPLLQLHLASSLTSQIRLITLLNPIFLISALNSSEHPKPKIVFVQSDLLHGVLEQLVEDGSKVQSSTGEGEGWKTLVVVVPVRGAYGEMEGLRKRAKGMGVEVVKFEELLKVDGAGVEEKIDKWEKPAPSDVHSLAYMPRGRDVSNPHLVEITNQNITAGISSILSIFPASLRPALRTGDTIKSSVNVNEPFGLGLMLGAIYAGAGFEYMEEGRGEDSMKGSTIAFVSRKDLVTTLDKIQSHAQSSPLYSTAERQRLAGMDDGYLAKTGWMEKLVWGRARTASGLGLERLRALVVVDDSPDPDLSIKAQLLLSMPFTRLTTSKLSTGPIFVSHFNDLQVGGLKDHRMHTGAPGSNVEVLLKGDGVEAVETGGDPQGKVLIRGPAVLKDINMEMNDDGWTSLNKEATARPNGTFVLA